MKNFLFKKRNNLIWLKGLDRLFTYALPISIPITLFIASMAYGAPNSDSFAYNVMYIWWTCIYHIGSVVLATKIVDFFFIFGRGLKLFTYFSIFLGVLIYAVWFNIAIDNLFQFKQGNYQISIIGIIILLIFWGIILFLGNIRYPKGIFEIIISKIQRQCKV